VILLKAIDRTRPLRLACMAEEDILKRQPGSFVLSSEQNAAIFRQEIALRELGSSFNHSSTDDGLISREKRQPVAILLLGQTGAGKSHLAPVIHSSMRKVEGQRPVVWLVADRYKHYHPAFARLAHELGRPDLAYRATTKDARVWLQRAVEETTLHGNDLLVESACRHPDDVQAILEALTAAKYRRYVVFLAVNEGVSRLGLLARYYNAVGGDERWADGKGGLKPRRTPAMVHDETYTGLLQTAENIDAEVDRVIVMRRGGEIAYDHSHSLAATTQSYIEGLPGASAVLKSERAKSLSPDESKAVMADIVAIRQAGGEQGAADIASIQAMLDMVLTDTDRPPMSVSAANGDELGAPVTAPPFRRDFFDQLVGATADQIP
jgi:UDP-N-acetylglucosamine kinase